MHVNNNYCQLLSFIISIKVIYNIDVQLLLNMSNQNLKFITACIYFLLSKNDPLVFTIKAKMRITLTVVKKIKITTYKLTRNFMRELH